MNNLQPSYKTLAMRIIRHRKSLKYITWKRIFNLLKLLRDIKLRRVSVDSFPIFARINTCSICNIMCPGCQIYDDKTGRKKYFRPKGIMEIDTYKKIIDSLKDSLLQVVLYDEGEPLLNKRIWEMVKYANRNRLRTVISSNLSFKMSDEFIAQLFESGLDYLIVALDGITQETYEKHRQGGDVELVKSNFERIMMYRRKLAKKTKLEVEVQFIEFDFNTHEKSSVVDYAARHGADSVNAFLSYTEEFSDTRSLQGKSRREFGCFDVYAIADFDVDGSLFVCDLQEDCGVDSIGKIQDCSFVTMWNGPEMKSIRCSFQTPGKYEMNSICLECPITRGLPLPLR